MVGSGISGLAAALRLHLAGHDVELIEASDTLGGRFGVARLGDRPVMTGGKNIGRRYTAFRAFTAELGVDSYDSFGYNASRIKDGEVLTLDSERRGETLKNIRKMGSTRDFARMAAMAARIRMDDTNRFLASRYFSGISRRHDHAPLSGYFGPEMTDMLIRPMVIRNNGAEPDEVYPGTFGTNLSMLMDHYDQLAGGIQPALDALAKRVTVRLGARVEGLVVHGGRVTGLSVSDHGGPAQESSYDGVVLATPAYATADIVGGERPALGRRLKDVRYFPPRSCSSSTTSPCSTGTYAPWPWTTARAATPVRTAWRSGTSSATPTADASAGSPTPPRADRRTHHPDRGEAAHLPRRAARQARQHPGQTLGRGLLRLSAVPPRVPGRGPRVRRRTGRPGAGRGLHPGRQHRGVLPLRQRRRGAAGQEARRGRRVSAGAPSPRAWPWSPAPPPGSAPNSPADWPRAPRPVAGGARRRRHGDPRPGTARDPQGGRAGPPCDLSDTDARQALADELATAPVAVFCANAGFPTCGSLAANDPVQEAAEIQVNVVALHQLTLAVLPGMLDRGRGRLLVTGSTAGRQPVPTAATYSATKAFANTFAESLHEELRGTGVTCTLLAPGPVTTRFYETGGIPGSRSRRSSPGSPRAGWPPRASRAWPAGAGWSSPARSPRPRTSPGATLRARSSSRCCGPGAAPAARRQGRTGAALPASGSQEMRNHGR
ncbi:SDR family NAD(P)-dependent oxidoreductase [Streptomyces sp. M19]